jgi:hypothetical protein
MIDGDDSHPSLVSQYRYGNKNRADGEKFV